MKAESNFKIFVAHPFKSLAPLKKIIKRFTFWAQTLFQILNIIDSSNMGQGLESFQTLNISVSSNMDRGQNKYCFRHWISWWAPFLGPRYVSDIKSWWALIWAQDIFQILNSDGKHGIMINKVCVTKYDSAFSYVRSKMYFLLQVF